MSCEDISVDTVDNRIAVVTLNRPALLNAFNTAMDRELESAISPVPEPGQHTDEVLRAVLGYSADRIEQLRESSVI